MLEQRISFVIPIGLAWKPSLIKKGMQKHDQRRIKIDVLHERRTNMF